MLDMRKRNSDLRKILQGKTPIPHSEFTDRGFSKEG